MKTITISPQGQITIPTSIRRSLNLRAGTKLILNIVDWIKTKAIIIQPEPKSWVDQVAGTGTGMWGKSSDAYLEKERKLWENK